MEAYLQSQKALIERGSRLIKDWSVFDFNHVPSEPILRPEAKDLIDSILHFGLTGIATHHAVVGSRGSGKTLTLKHLQGVVPQQADVDMVYVNCRSSNTSFGVLSELLHDSRAPGSASAHSTSGSSRPVAARRSLF